MSKYYMHSKNIVLVSIIVALFLGSVPAQAEMNNSTLEYTDLLIENQLHYYDFNSDLISVFYVENDELSKNTANAITDSLSLMTPDVEAYAVSTIDELNLILENNDFQIAVYVFPTDIDGILLSTNRLVQWDNFGKLLENYKDIYHIFAGGNSLQLQNALGHLSYLFTSGDEQVDSQHVFVYTLWTIADILENRFDGKHSRLGSDIRMASLQYFSNNINSLISSSIEPANPVGVKDPMLIQHRVDNYYAKHQDVGSRIARDGFVIDENLNRDVNPTTGEVADYTFDIFPSSAIQPNDLILNEFTTYPKLTEKIETGIRGPIGNIIDQILPVLLAGAGNTVGLSGSAVDSISDILRSIPDLIGAVSNPSASTLKKLLDNLRPTIPIPEDQTVYFDVLVDSLFMLRGNPNDIETFIGSTIDLILPDGYDIGGVGLEDIVSQFFDITDIVSELDSGEDIFDLLGGTFNEKMIISLVNSLLKDDVFGLGADNTKAIGIIGGILAMVSHILMGGDIDLLLEKYGPRLITQLDTFLNGFDLGSQFTNLLMSSIGLILTATGVMEGPSLDELLFKYLTELFANEIQDAERIKLQAELIIDAINNAIESPPTSVQDFKDRYLHPALDLSGVS
ncbi:MAG: hypothetical protein ACXAD7_17755, partial [Candidatus Kariarchaeaceae archaeon]